MMRNKTIVAGMVMAMVILAFSVGFAQNPPDKPGPRGMGERLASFLELTPEQQARFDEIRKARQDEAKAFREEMAKLRPQFREAMKDPNADPKKLDGLIDQMSQVRAAHLKSAIRGFRDMEKILTPEQLEKFRRARSGMGWGHRFGPHRWMRPGWGPRPFWGFGWGPGEWF